MPDLPNAHLVDLLQRAADTRQKVVHNNPAESSPAHADQLYSVRKTGDEKVSSRLVLGADVFTAVAADQLGALATLVRGGDTVFGLFPLMRAAIENAVGVLWLLDPAASHVQRWARAGLAEYDTLSRDLDIVSHWLAKADQGRGHQKKQRTDLRKELEASFPLPTDIQDVDIPETRKLDAPPYALAGETIPTIEHNISSYLDDTGHTTWRGVYGYLCSRGTHASLGSAQFIDALPLGTGFTLSGPRLIWLVRATLAAYGRALEHFVQWCGWNGDPVDELIYEISLLDPMDGENAS
jgi:hypothetical protein